MSNTSNKLIEYGFLILIFIGGVLEASALYVDYTDPSFFLALDLEIAGLALIFFGFIGDILYSHVSN